LAWQLQYILGKENMNMKITVGMKIRMANQQIVEISEITERFSHIERKLGSNEQRDVYKTSAIFDGGPYSASLELLTKGLDSGRYQLVQVKP
jgi:hypothetical protein